MQTAELDDLLYTDDMGNNANSEAKRNRQMIKFQTNVRSMTMHEANEAKTWHM